MSGPGRRGSGRRTLVVGAGLAGATVTWLATRAGDAVSVVSIDRPASRATALSPGIVHGIGPPGKPLDWAELSEDAHCAAVRQALRGYELLQDLLLVSGRSCGLTRLRHEMAPPVASDGAWLETVLARLRAAGWPVEARHARGGPCLCRQDAVLNPRRLVYELLHAARRAGARLRLGLAIRAADARDDGQVAVRIGTELALFHRVFWAGGQAPASSRWQSPGRPRLVLHQQLAAGREPLDALLETGDRGVVLSPDPLRPGRAVLVRVADESPGGGLHWPAVPAEWEPFRGPAIRQRLAEAFFDEACTPALRAGSIIRLQAIAGWPITAVLGACAEVHDSTN